MNKKLLCFIPGLVGMAPMSMGATINVHDGATITANDGLCSLQEAIANANTDSRLYPKPGECPQGDGQDVINLPANGAFDFEERLPLVLSDVQLYGNNSILAGRSFISVSDVGTLEVVDLTLAGPDPDGQVSLSTGSSAATLVAVGVRIEDRYVAAQNRGTMTLIDCTITNNNAAFSSGGVKNISGTLSILNSRITNNGSATDIDAPLTNWAGGTVFVTESTISANGRKVGAGGGVLNSGTMEIRRSTIAGNISYREGGGILNRGNLTVENSTVSGNISTSNQGGGGGIHNLDGGKLTVVNATIANNEGVTGAGVWNLDGEMNLINTVISGSEEFDSCANESQFGANISNWISDGSCYAKFSGDPGLGAFAFNGGPTATHALLTGSGAIDAGDDLSCSKYDQRGVPREGQCDIGAFEFQSVIFSSKFELPVEKDPKP